MAQWKRLRPSWKRLYLVQCANKWASACALPVLLSGCVLGGAEKNLALQQVWGDYAHRGEPSFQASTAAAAGEDGTFEASSHAEIREDSVAVLRTSDTKPDTRLAHAEVSRAVQTSFIRAEAEGRTAVDASAAAGPHAAPQRVNLRSRKPDADSKALLGLAEQLAMPGSGLENPCLASTARSGCSHHAMTSFFEALDRAAGGTGRARITVFGNSLHASDRIVDVIRARMQTQFGNAGQGFLLPDRLANYGSRSRTGYGTRGFVPYNVVWGAKTKFPMGAAGSLHLGKNRATSRFSLQGESTVRLFALAHPRGGQLRVSTEAGTESFSMRAAKQEGRFIDFALPAGAKELKLESLGGQVPVYGASLEQAGPGVMLDTLAIIGADSTRYLRSDADLFRTHLQALQPDLVTLFLGGNEVKRIAWRSSTPDIVRRDLGLLLERVRGALPGASCLVIGPLENVAGSQPTRQKRARPVEKPWSGRPETLWVNDIMRDEARQNGCAFFDLYAAMGSAGALQRLHVANMLHADMIHPKGKGLDVIGELVFDAMMRAYVANPVAATGRAPLARTAFR